MMIAMVAISTLVGCNGNEGENKKQSSVEKNLKENNEENSKEKIKAESEFNIYDDIIALEFRGVNLPEVIRNPDKFKEKNFSVLGNVISSKTTTNGIQEVVLEIIDSETAIQTESTPKRSNVKLNYNPKYFDGNRLVENDCMAFGVTLKGLETSEDYGDLLVFDVNASVDAMSYLSAMAIDKNFKDMGLDSKDMELKILNPNNYEGVMSDEEVGMYNGSGQQVTVLTSKNGVYWLATVFEDSEYGSSEISISTGKKDDREEVFFEHKADVQLYEMKF